MDIAYYSLASIDSTNDYAKRNAAAFQTNHLNVVSASEQTAGKGREQRPWLSPIGENLYVSFCFFLPLTFPHLGNCGQLLAISTAKVLEKEGFHPQLKWPNDILIRGFKVGGILCETQVQENQIFVVDGLGLNISTQSNYFESQGLTRATSLEIEREKPVDKGQILQKIAKEFSEDIDIFIKKGFSPFFEDLKRWMSPAFNTSIRFKNRGVIWEGIFHSLNEEGTLNLQLPNGEIKNFSAGDIIL